METDQRPARILVADDQEDIRALLEAVIGAEEGLEVVGAAETAEQAIQLAEVLRPDVALLDWMMPGGGGSAARGISACCPETRILAFTAGDQTQASYDMLGAGAIGFLSKSSTHAEIIAGIRSVMQY